MASTVLPRITSSVKAEENRHWTPGPAYLPGTSQRDPIVGTVKPYPQPSQARPSSFYMANNRPKTTNFNRVHGNKYICLKKKSLKKSGNIHRQKTLPDIYQRNFNKNSRYELRVVVMVDKKTGKKIKFPKMKKGDDGGDINEEDEKTRFAKSSFQGNIHQRSVFEDTSYRNSYFIISPEWTSEPSGIRRLSSRGKSHSSLDCRPAVHPLSSYIEPLLEKRRLRDQYIKAMDQAKHIEQYHARIESRAQSKRRQMKPMTPKEPNGQYKAFSMY